MIAVREDAQFEFVRAVGILKRTNSHRKLQSHHTQREPYNTHTVHTGMRCLPTEGEAAEGAARLAAGLGAGAAAVVLAAAGATGVCGVIGVCAVSPLII